jgi:multiple sugar transport system permease protein
MVILFADSLTIIVLITLFLAVLALITFIIVQQLFLADAHHEGPEPAAVSADCSFVEGGAYGLKWLLIMAASAFIIALCCISYGPENHR